MDITDHPVMQHIIGQYMFEPWDHITRKSIEEHFRLKCPGPYKLVWQSDLNEDCMPMVSLEFDNNADVTVWILKWL